MKIEVYCDENHPELFTTTKQPLGRYLMIGSLWLPAGLRKTLKTEIEALREKHGIGSEFKWHKVQRGKLPFYLDLVDLFGQHGDNLRFRCIAVDKEKFNIKLHNDDAELGFYKFYYQLLHHWMSESNEYAIFCDQKSNSDPRRLHKLTEVLSNATPSATIAPVQALPSWQVTMIQYCDFLLGAAAARMNNKVKIGTPKAQVIERLELQLKREIGASWQSEKKFNVFCINLRGNW